MDDKSVAAEVEDPHYAQDSRRIVAALISSTDGIFRCTCQI
jgi:hypothetical protein